jgi:hypothetical protein
VSYFGTYSVDEAAQKVTHQVEAALVPGWVGTSLVRAFQIDSSNGPTSHGGLVRAVCIAARSDACRPPAGGLA